MKKNLDNIFITGKWILYENTINSLRNSTLILLIPLLFYVILLLIEPTIGLFLKDALLLLHVEKTLYSSTELEKIQTYPHVKKLLADPEYWTKMSNSDWNDLHLEETKNKRCIWKYTLIPFHIKRKWKSEYLNKKDVNNNKYFVGSNFKIVPWTGVYLGSNLFRVTKSFIHNYPKEQYYSFSKYWFLWEGMGSGVS